MRLSEAIALGRTLLNPVPGSLFAGEDGGCAQGMALRCIGKKTTAESRLGIGDDWPWTLEVVGKFPCECVEGRPEIFSDGWFPYADTRSAIAHLFDSHVMGRHQDWTLDQLIDWVRSVEPAEPPLPEQAIAESEASTEQVAKKQSLG